MTKDEKLSAEIAALRADIEALRAERREHADTALLQPTETVGGTSDTLPNETASLVFPEQLRDLEQAVQELAETVEADITKRPVVSVGAAFLLGILVGRSMAR